MKNLIKIWQERQRKYEDQAQMWEGNEHNHRKFTYKAMATRDCWKEFLQYKEERMRNALNSKEYQEQYFNSPTFNRALDSISHGVDEIDIIYQMSLIIQEQQETMKKLLMNTLTYFKDEK